MRSLLRCSRPVTLAVALVIAPDLVAHDVVINEIMYHPPNDVDLAQFIELHNRGTQPVEVSGWAFTKGIHFKFPNRCTIPAHGFLVVCRNRPTFAAYYGQVAMVLGDFTNRLSHGSKRLELRDAQGQVVDSLKYSDTGDWPTAPDGYSASLERICPGGPSEDAANWTPSKLRSPTQPGGTPGRRNDGYSAQMPPVIAQIEATKPAPAVPVTVRALISDPEGVAGATLLHTAIAGGPESAEVQVAMRRVAGDERRGTAEGTIPAQPAGRMVRWRVRATDALGVARTEPLENEPRPTFTYSTFPATNAAQIPLALVFQINPSPERGGGRPANGATAAFGNGMFLLVPPGGGEARVFDHVGLTPRRGGFKILFQKDRMLDGISTLNVAVNQCIQNWDGYFNNHFAYHDSDGTGRWEIYPWDADKTWGDYDGASARFDWYSMPLTFGMNGDRPVGTGWWREPGQLSGPLLANDEFRRRFLARLREICETVFTPEKLFPFIDALQTRLEPEIEERARLGGENVEAAKQRFRQDVQSFRNQVQHRRGFLLQRHP